MNTVRFTLMILISIFLIISLALVTDFYIVIGLLITICVIRAVFNNEHKCNNQRMINVAGLRDTSKRFVTYGGYVDPNVRQKEVNQAILKEVNKLSTNETNPYNSLDEIPNMCQYLKWLGQHTHNFQLHQLIEEKMQLDKEVISFNQELYKVSAESINRCIDNNIFSNTSIDTEYTASGLNSVVKYSAIIHHEEYDKISDKNEWYLRYSLPLAHRLSRKIPVNATVRNVITCKKNNTPEDGIDIITIYVEYIENN